jgi:Flp pilus assembly secretin CpaC
MRRLSTSVALVVLSIAVSLHSAPQSTASAVSPSVLESSREIQLRVGSSNVLTFSSPVTRISVGREDLVRVHILRTREILLQGLQAGTTTLFVWLRDGRRLEYDLVVLPSTEALQSILREVDPNIEVQGMPEGTSLILRGEVPSEAVASEAGRLAESLMGKVRVINLLRYPGAATGLDSRLISSLAEVDGRIRVRRVESAAENVPSAIVLEGRVRDVNALVKAMTLAELHIGGQIGKIEPVQDEPRHMGRNNQLGGAGGSGIGGSNSSRAETGLSTDVARGLILRSSSGRVLSFLQVDDVPQIRTTIRVLQVDRGKARAIGFDYRIDAEHVSIGSYHAPGSSGLPKGTVSGGNARGGGVSSLTGANLVATFVDQTIAIAAAIDLLEQKALARSVAEPNITTLSGEEAMVLVGGEVPVPITTVGETAAVQGFNFQSFGVRLALRPTLAEDGLIAMELSPSIIRPAAGLAVGGVPGFSVQSVQTTARVAPGESLIIGGLLSFMEDRERRGIPGLSEIPVLRSFFSWEGRSRNEQELLFVITPRVVTSSAPEPIILPPLDWEDDDSLHWEGPGEPGRLDPNGLPPSFVAPPPPSEPMASNQPSAPDRDPR